MATFTLEGYRFHREHGASSYMPAYETLEQGEIRGAIASARAEHWFRTACHRYWIQWVDDDETNREVADHPGAQGTAEGPFYGCIIWEASELWGDPESVASLWAIDGAGPGDPYRRVVEAELLYEIMPPDALPAMDRPLARV